MSGGEEEVVAAAAADAALDPGCARQGNFPNYYQFNAPDKRIQHIPTNLLSQHLGGGGKQEQEVLALDVGCNSGVSST